MSGTDKLLSSAELLLSEMERAGLETPHSSLTSSPPSLSPRHGTITDSLKTGTENEAKYRQKGLSQKSPKQRDDRLIELIEEHDEQLVYEGEDDWSDSVALRSFIRLSKDAKVRLTAPVDPRARDRTKAGRNRKGIFSDMGQDDSDGQDDLDGGNIGESAADRSIRKLVSSHMGPLIDGALDGSPWHASESEGVGQDKEQEGEEEFESSSVEFDQDEDQDQYGEQGGQGEYEEHIGAGEGEGRSLDMQDLMTTGTGEKEDQDQDLDLDLDLGINSLEEVKEGPLLTLSRNSRYLSQSTRDLSLHDDKGTRQADFVAQRALLKKVAREFTEVQVSQV